MEGKWQPALSQKELYLGSYHEGQKKVLVLFCCWSVSQLIDPKFKFLICPDSLYDLPSQ